LRLLSCGEGVDGEVEGAKKPVESFLKIRQVLFFPEI
jgi:hypothetical protein